MNIRFMTTRLPVLVLLLICTPLVAGENNPKPPFLSRMTSSVRNLLAPSSLLPRQDSQLGKDNNQGAKSSKSALAKFCYVSASIATVGLFCYGSYQALYYLDTQISGGIKRYTFNFNRQSRQ